MNNSYLYEKINIIKECVNISLEIPKIIISNLNPKFELRKYQREAIENFMFYMENGPLQEKSFQLLFHMATGSGKTLIMASLVLYLYKKGYRNFLFFCKFYKYYRQNKRKFSKQTFFQIFI